MKPLKSACLACLLMALAGTAPAQDTRNPDVLFEQAREAAFQREDYPEAIRLARRSLELTPGYTDVRVFLGRLYFWNGMAADARNTFQEVLRRDPERLDGRVELINLELESGRAGRALELADRGLELFPNNTDLLFRKGQALEMLGREKEALDALREVRRIDPGYPHLRSLARRLRGLMFQWQAMVSYAYERFNGTFDPWHLGTFELLRETVAGNFIGRVHYDRRFDQTDYQVELDAYPMLTRSLYAYANAGYSGDTFFPTYRAGISLFYLMPKSFEAGLGVRYLHFRDPNLMIYTASLSKYYRNYWFSVRPFFTPALEQGSSVSGLVIVRRYLTGPDNYLSLRTGFGSSPTGLNSQQDIARLNSVRIELVIQHMLSPQFLFRGRIGFMREEYRTESYRNRLIGGLNFYFRF